VADTQREQFPDSSVIALWAPGKAVAAVRERLRELGVERALIVCGETVGQSDVVRELAAETAAPRELAAETAAPRGLAAETAAPRGGLAMFAQVEPDPSDATIAAGGQAAREAGAQAIVAIGGGSSLDAGKAIAAEAGRAGWMAEQDRPGQPTVIEHGALPIIAVPTTAGTGSEVTPFSVITFRETQRKLVLNHPAMFPRFAVMDATLLASAARGVRVAAGMDALTHAVESYVSRQATPGTRARCAEAISLIGRNLRQATAEPPDTEALAAMQRAALVAGLAFSKTRLGIVHAMALPLSALFHVPHGIANAILLPHGMRFNHLADAAGFAAIARALGCDTEGLSEEEAALAAVTAVEALADDVGAPRRMSEVGVAREAIARMVEDAMPSAHLKVNPREVARNDVVAVYEGAY